ncbi:MAG: flagellar hook-basal body complex protein FliE [Archaeoglobus sp.]|uniref:AAA family ATPase n=1 Tax=Archaeoglobus sp. TaxID=1872626 RepID=UPI001D4605F9|nr:AAA family ATPase [Archaeoglobus sp.]MBO8179716.1 flagellar hook-basal body complex protein FliE [Archaeoglobus sp.]
MKVIAFVGYPLSGKSTASHVARELGLPVVVMGDVVREEALRRGLELTDENLGKVARELREKEGMDAIAKRCIPKIRELLKEHGVVVVDGIRGVAEIERFKKAFGDDFILIAIESPLEVRFERAKMRNRSDDVSSIEDLKERDRREESWGLKEAMEIADFTVENIGSYEDFVEKIRQILIKLARNVEIEIRTKVHPTEGEEKVVKAIKNIFPDAEIEIREDGEVYGRAYSLERFRELLRRQRILDTARSEILKRRDGNEVTLYLNKQTATVSRINFCDEDAVLSPIKVTFRLNNIPFSRFLDYIAPETKDGRPVKEIERL